MKKYLIILAALLSCGFTYPEKPTTRLNDYANVLTDSQKGTLVEDLKKIETNTGAQVAVAIFPTIEGNSIEDVANNLARKWKLGHKDKNDGVLLVLAMQEHKMRIEVGYGLEGLLTDATSNNILRNSVRPHLKSGDVFGAIEAFGNDVSTVLSQGSTTAPVPTATEPKKEDDDNTLPLVLGLLGIGGVIGFSVYRTNKRRKEEEAELQRQLDAVVPCSTASVGSSGSSPRSEVYMTPVYVPSMDSYSRSSSRDDDDDSSSSSSSGSSSSDDSYSSSSSSDWSSSDSGFGGGGGDFGGGGSSSDW